MFMDLTILASVEAKSVWQNWRFWRLFASHNYEYYLTDTVNWHNDWSLNDDSGENNVNCLIRDGPNIFAKLTGDFDDFWRNF